MQLCPGFWEGPEDVGRAGLEERAPSTLKTLKVFLSLFTLLLCRLDSLNYLFFSSQMLHPVYTVVCMGNHYIFHFIHCILQILNLFVVIILMNYCSLC